MGSDQPDTMTQVREIPEWARPYAENLLTTGMDAVNQPVQEYGGMRVAPQNQAQQVGLSMMMGRALSGSPDEMAGRQQALNTAQGGYLGGSPGFAANQYAGPNQYLDRAVGNTLSGMADNYKVGTAAQTDAMAARSKAYGGSAHTELTGRNNANLASQMANTANDMYMKDYTTQQQLAESGLNRAQGAFDTERNRMMGAVPLAFQGSQMDYDAAGRMIQAGDAQSGYTQRLLDQAYSDYMTQSNRPFESIDRAGNLLGLAIGNQGATTVRNQGGGGMDIGNMLGAGMAGYGLYSAFQ